MLRINEKRLWNELMRYAQIGGTQKGGVCRITLTDKDKTARDTFIKDCKKENLTVEIDKMGNIFARRKGKNNDLPAIMMGSHLDSQPTGGKFDGVLGVLAGLEVIRTLNEQNTETEHPIELVSWTNEEGARFAPAMIGSGVFSGDFTLEFAHAIQDEKGVTIGEELRRIGYLGKTQIGNRPYAATFELHIEQGPILEAEEKPVGIVTGVQGIRWYDLVIHGKETHAGPSPMSFREDPVQVLPEIISKIYAIAEGFSPDARATVGYIQASPGVRNTVPGQLIISVDLRHPDASILEKMHNELNAICGGENSPKTELKEIWDSPPVVFAENCVNAVTKAVEKLQLPAIKMVSGAGHDSVYVSNVAPTSMIFIPCKDGLSHNEAEYAKPEDVAAGANVLLHAVLIADGNSK